MKDEDYYKYSNSCYIKSAAKPNNKANTLLKAKEERLKLKEIALKSLELKLNNKENELREKEDYLIKKEEELNKLIQEGKVNL